jgi:putative flippase GtrA
MSKNTDSNTTYHSPEEKPYVPDAKETRSQVVKFALFSASAGIIETVSFTLMKLLTPFKYWPCYLVALVLSVLWNFTLNREFTFKSSNNVPKAMFLVFLFYCVFTPLSTIGGNYLSESAHWNDYAVLFVTMGCNLVSEYLYDRFVVYRNSMNTNARGKRALEKKAAEEKSLEK